MQTICFTRHALNDHINVSHLGLVFRCTDCAKISDTICLSVHKREHVGPERFGCPHCGIRVPYKSTYDVHLTKHTGEKPYICFQCNSRYSHASTLSRHSRYVGKTQQDINATAAKHSNKNDVCQNMLSYKHVASSWNRDPHCLCTIQTASRICPYSSVHVSHNQRQFLHPHRAERFCSYSWMYLPTLYTVRHIYWYNAAYMHTQLPHRGSWCGPRDSLPCRRRVIGKCVQSSRLLSKNNQREWLKV